MSETGFKSIIPRENRNKPNNQQQVGGTHYTSMGVQPWEALDSWLSPEELRGYHKATAIGYLAREHSKGGDEDIKKAHHHLSKLVELLG